MALSFRDFGAFMEGLRALGLAEEAAISIMARQRGTHLDPRIFDVFLELLPEIRRIGELGRHDSASTRLQDAA